MLRFTVVIGNQQVRYPKPLTLTPTFRNFNNSFLLYYLHIPHISWKSAHNVLSFSANKQTDKRGSKQYLAHSGGDSDNKKPR